jgi:hypothetical protein
LDLPKGEKPKLKHFNVHEDHVTVMDEELGMLVDVYIRDKKLHCDYDLSDSCEHVEFVKNIEKVRKKLEKEGVDIKD